MSSFDRSVSDDNVAAAYAAEGDPYGWHVPRWIRHVVWPAALVIPLGILLGAEARLWPSALLGYVNCLIYGFATVYFIRQGTLGHLIPVLSMSWLVLGSCLGVVYFSIFYPEGGYYNFLYGRVGYFEGGVRFQLAIFCFLTMYLGTMALLLRRERGSLHHPGLCGRPLGYIIGLIIMPMILLHAATQLGFVPEFLKAWGNRIFNYFAGLPFILGAMVRRLSRTFILFLLAFMAAAMLFYTLGNSRGFALLPVAALTGGLFLFSELKQRTRKMLLVAIMIGFPMYLLIGNTTRVLLGSVGVGSGNLAHRWETLKRWREVAERTPVGANFFGRLFFTGGNTVVAKTPSAVPYFGLRKGLYFWEYLTVLLPGQVQLNVDLFRPYYSTPFILRQYGVMVTQTTSVEISIIGHCFMVAGLPMCALGGLMAGGIHAFSAWRIRRAWLVRPDKGLLYFGVFSKMFIWTCNRDLIMMWRDSILHLAFAWALWIVVRPLLAVLYASAPAEERPPLAASWGAA